MISCTGTMEDLTVLYKRLLDLGEGDIVVKLKDGEQIKVVSYIIKNRSSVFRAILETDMIEKTIHVVDLSSLYRLEAFKEFLAYIYYNKLHVGIYIPLMFEILAIAHFFNVSTYTIYMTRKICSYITDKPTALIIAAEALKQGSATDIIFEACTICLGKKPHAIELPAFLTTLANAESSSKQSAEVPTIYLSKYFDNDSK